MKKIIEESEKVNILVTGDFIVDRNILPGHRTFALDSPLTGTRMVDIFGGSLLTSSLVNSLIAVNETKKVSCSFDLEESTLENFISEYPERTAFSTWVKQKKSMG